LEKAITPLLIGTPVDRKHINPKDWTIIVEVEQSEDIL
jgi:hypothetical protein